ncbi:Isoleucine-tRNA ligase, partial [human gut metagenome]
ESFKDYIKTETLAVEIKSVDNASFEKYDLNGHETGINITKK